jgi:hypothetical protein
MQLIKRLIPFAISTLIVLAALQPQSLCSQYSDSTIKEINQRLIKCIECEEKLTLYKELAKSDSTQIMNQAAIITNQEQTISQEKSKNKTLQKINAVQFALLVLALIL